MPNVTTPDIEEILTTRNMKEWDAFIRRGRAGFGQPIKHINRLSKLMASLPPKSRLPEGTDVKYIGLYRVDVDWYSEIQVAGGASRVDNYALLLWAERLLIYKKNFAAHGIDYPAILAMGA